MRWSDLQIRVPGKWVLAGEHSVLRGSTAIALPHTGLSLQFKFHPDDSGKLTIHPPQASDVIGDLLQAIRDEWEVEGRSFPFPQGDLEIESSIPVGAGLGSSAALCVALAKWLQEPLGIQEPIQDFATRLEHRFHGQSSGMDVAVIFAEKPISFVRDRGPKVVEIRKTPRFTFHDTGIRTRTSDCVARVRVIHEEDPSRALAIDELMSSAARSALEGLVAYDSGNQNALSYLASAMNQAQDCFNSWNLVPLPVFKMVKELKSQGALGVKLTGAGGGGMVVALWDE